MTITGSGAREIYRVFRHLNTIQSKPTFALANRLILQQNGCEIWSLSPGDTAILNFLHSIKQWFPGKGQGKFRVSDRSPNQVAVVLLVKVGEISVLLGSDLERGGWVEVLQNPGRPSMKASVFKVPHHGSKGADSPEVWNKMLELDPIAMLTPWRRGGNVLPTDTDIQRILSYSQNAFSTSATEAVMGRPVSRLKPVDRTIRESGIKLRHVQSSEGSIRLRRSFNSPKGWTHELFGSAYSLGYSSG